MQLHGEVVDGLKRGKTEGPGEFDIHVPQLERQRAARVLASRLRATGWLAEFAGEWLKVKHRDLA